MPIFDQGYQHWQGALSGHSWRWIAVTRQGVRMQRRSRWTTAMVVMACAPALSLAAALILWGLFERQSTVLKPLAFLIQGLPEELKAGPQAYRSAFWTMAFHYFFNVQTFFVMMLVVMVGPDLISQDLRFNAMPLYFSRPLRRVDYFLGKLGVIGTYLAAVSILPILLAYLLGLAFCFDLGVVRETGSILGAAVIYGLVVMVSAGPLMLAFSSLSRNSRYVGAMWIGLWVVSAIGANVLKQTVGASWCPIVSYTGDLARIREALLDTDTARQKFLDLADASRRAALQRTQFRPRRFFLPQPPPPPPPPPQEPVEAQPPWTWSAGALAGLFVLSVWTLTTRVKSLDRLK